MQRGTNFAHGNFNVMARPKLTNRRKDPYRLSTIVGVAWFGLAVLIMVAIVGAVYWSNPASNNGTSQIRTKPSSKSQTTGSSGFH